MTRPKFPYRRQSHGQAHETVVVELTIELQQMQETRRQVRRADTVTAGFLISVPLQRGKGKPALLVLRGGLRSDWLKPQQNSGIAQ